LILLLILIQILQLLLLHFTNNVRCKHKKVKKEERFFRRFFSDTPVLDFDLRSAEKSSEIMADLLTMGKPVNALDVLIAGIAVTNGADKIASTDKRFDEISKVTGLEIFEKQKRMIRAALHE